MRSRRCIAHGMCRRAQRLQGYRVARMDESVASGGAAESLHGDRVFRRRAMTRSWVCPGAGYALLGHRGAALLTYAVTIGLLPAVAWVALRPGASAAWAALGVFVLAGILGLVEQ